MRNVALATALIITTFACVSYSQQTTRITDSPESPGILSVGQQLRDAKNVLSEQEIEVSEGGFAFANKDPNLANWIVIIDKNHTFACLHYSKSQSKVTGLHLIFFPSRQHGKASESWLPATEIKLNDDRTYTVKFAAPLTDDDLKKLKANRPATQLPKFNK